MVEWAVPEFRTVGPGPELHRLLLRMAGYAPDHAIVEARYALAKGQIVDVTRAVASVAANAGLFLAEEEVDLIAAVDPERAGVLSSGMGQGRQQRTSFTFHPALGEDSTFTPQATPPLLDLTDAPPEIVGALTDEMDRAATETLSQVPGVTALWRAWRLGVPSGIGRTPARVFVLAADVPADYLPVVTAMAQQELGTVGAPQTLVEVFAPGDELPAYQMQARGSAALLWTAAEAYPIAVSPVFDGVDAAAGPWFAPDHPLLDGVEQERVAAFLDSGWAVLTTTRRENDVVEPNRGVVVPMSYRTDGVWVWTDTVTYYLRAHGLAPAAALLDHIRCIDYRTPEVDEVAEHRVLAALFRPAAPSPATAR
ncbi:hypothetical protein Sar04_12670 [Salinispora arenicola]|uniref:Uncharacterized protein n=1 Tax=Salinispora arenicola TaxID=168697 RepID=A0ABQ4JNK3_SALAC|nr:hypothetical protein Sar04_12670 [Salinispora arenicola]